VAMRAVIFCTPLKRNAMAEGAAGIGGVCDNCPSARNSLILKQRDI
jgi:hypothetical protein